MVSKRTLLKIFINIIGVVCLLLYIYVRLKEKPFNVIDKEYIMEEQKGIYGDLYNMILVDKFKLTLPEFYPPFRESNENSKADEADILIFGDSFFDIGSHTRQITRRISDTLDKKVCFMGTYNCLAELNEIGYKKGKRKILIYEIVERNILDIFAYKQRLFNKKINASDEIRGDIFPFDAEQRYNFLLQKSMFTRPIYIALANFKFNYLNCISSATPVYSKEPPWLFYYLEVNNGKTSFYYKYNYDEITNVSDNIEDLRKKLDEQFNLELLFVPIPNKYTIYHSIINNDTYNNLLPNLYSELNQRNIKCVELLYDFLNSDKILYYQTDTHYNIEGENIVLNKIINVINNFEK